MSQTFLNDALPPEGMYESRESLLAAINSWAKPRGYAFTTGKSSKTANGRVKVVFACDRNRLPPSPSVQRKRHTSSRGTGCKFSVLAKESLDGNTWVLSHRPDKECALHNHAPSENASAHPVHRQLDRKDIDIVSSLTTVGVAPQDIGSSLHNNSDTLATPQGVYPVKKAPSKCSKCHQVGHHMGANVCPLKYSEQLPASPLAQDATSKVLGNSTVAETCLISIDAGPSRVCGSSRPSPIKAFAPYSGTRADRTANGARTHSARIDRTFYGAKIDGIWLYAICVCKNSGYNTRTIKAYLSRSYLWKICRCKKCLVHRAAGRKCQNESTVSKSNEASATILEILLQLVPGL